MEFELSQIAPVVAGGNTANPGNTCSQNPGTGRPFNGRYIQSINDDFEHRVNALGQRRRHDTPQAWAIGMVRGGIRNLYFEPTLLPLRTIPPGKGMTTPGTRCIAATASSAASSVTADGCPVSGNSLRRSHAARQIYPRPGIPLPSPEHARSRPPITLLPWKPSPKKRSCPPMETLSSPGKPLKQAADGQVRHTVRCGSITGAREHPCPWRISARSRPAARPASAPHRPRCPLRSLSR